MPLLHSYETATAAVCFGIALMVATVLYVASRCGRQRTRLVPPDAGTIGLAAVARALAPRPVVFSRPPRFVAAPTVH